MKVSNAVVTKQRRKKVLKASRGFWGARSKKYRRAIETLRRARVYAYRDRRARKREMRSLWITRISAAIREQGLTYSTFIHKLGQKNIIFSRDILSKIAAEYPEAFNQIVALVK